MARIQHLSPVLRFLLALVLGLGGSACASSGSSGSGRQVLVVLRDYKSGARFELASESHTAAVDYYSDARKDAVRKIQTDEVMSAFLGQLEHMGMKDHAQAGRAPGVGAGGVVSWGLDVESGTTQEHWLVGTGSTAAEWTEFQKCRELFLELYNHTVSYQTVENASGKQFFDGQQPVAPGKKPSR